MAYNYSHEKVHRSHSPPPASPMPSYRSSSQSETTSQSSPNGTIGSNSYATPSWAAPTTPHSWYGGSTSPIGATMPLPSLDGPPTGGMIAFTPTSPGFSDCSDECNYDAYGREKSIRAAGAKTRALSLLDDTIGGDVRVRAYSESHVEDRGRTVPSQQRLKHYYSKKQAHLRANELLNETVGSDVQSSAIVSPSNLPGDTVYEDSDDVIESMKKNKRTKDKLLERNANIRALALLHETVGKGINAEALMASNPLPKKASSAELRRAMVERYKEKQRAEAVAAKTTVEQQQHYVKTKQVQEVPIGQERLAESSRKVIKKENNPRDPETIAGMKCDLEIEREERAKDRALRMMKYGKIA